MRASVIYFWLFVTLSLTLQGCATNSGMERITPNSRASYTVKTVGVGDSFESAKDNGFRSAIQQVFGALTLTERTLVNDDLDERNFSYSKGIVDSFKVIDRYVDRESGLHHVLMSATVSESPVGKRILYSVENSAVDGGRIAQQLALGKHRIDQEKQRHRNAASVLSHLSENFAFSLFDLELAGVNVLKYGSDLMATSTVNISTNESVIKSICNAAHAYQSTKVSSDYTVDAGILWITNAYGCSGSFLAEAEIFQRIKRDFENVGVCATLVDKDGFEVASIFSVPKDLVGGLTRHPILNPGSVREVYQKNIADAKSQVEIGNSWRFHDMAVVRINKKLFGDSIVFRLEIPKQHHESLGKTDRIVARMSRREQCVGSVVFPSVWNLSGYSRE